MGHLNEKYSVEDTMRFTKLECELLHWQPESPHIERTKNSAQLSAISLYILSHCLETTQDSKPHRIFLISFSYCSAPGHSRTGAIPWRLFLGSRRGDRDTSGIRGTALAL